MVPPRILGGSASKPSPTPMDYNYINYMHNLTFTMQHDMQIIINGLHVDCGIKM